MTTLRRSLALPHAVALGLGAMLGTGVFVALALGAGVAGGLLPLAIVLGGGLATCNALSSAQLAAAFPVSGGTYEYATRLLHPALGFAAGWLFLCAKSASAGAAAIAFASYALGAHPLVRTPAAVGAVIVVTALVLAGVRRSAFANAVMVAVTLLALLVFAFACAPAAWSAWSGGAIDPVPRSAADLPGLFEATALVFVAYTGYGRIATLGEEVRAPRRTIPRAIAITLLVTGALYLLIGAVALGSAPARELARVASEGGAPLHHAAHAAGRAWVAPFLTIGAVSATLGVLLNLVLGLSRVVLAMARRYDLPRPLATITAGARTPRNAVVLVGVAVGAVAASGDLSLAWSLSAVAVLVYYALTNAAALRLPRADRLYPRWVAAVGLIGCLALAPWVEGRAMLVGAAALVVGFALRALFRPAQRA